MRLFVCVFLVAFTGFATLAQVPAFDKDEVRRLLDDLYSGQFTGSGPGCAVIVARGGEVIYKNAFGKADLELGVSMKPEHLFRIGSITKQFTAVAILQLVEKGALTLKDDITRFLPGYPTHGYSITIENLLSHTSGIKNMTEIKDLNIGTKPYTPLELIDLFKDEPLDFEPGTQYRYSNSGYVILGFIIEKASGLKYDEYLTNNIFKPLGLRNSYYDNAAKVIVNRTKGYVQINDTTAANAEYLNTSFPFAAGALLMNIDDIFSWHQALVENKLLKKETLKLAQTPFTLKGGTKTQYGFGWELSDLYGSATTGHSGSINGYASMEIYLPAEDLFIATFCNVINKNVVTLTKLAACLITSKSIIKEITLPESAFKNYTGVYKYKLDQPASTRVFSKEGEYYMQDSRSSKAWKMHFTSATDFFCYEVFPNNHIFTRNSSGIVDGFMIKAPTYESRITKVE